MAGKISQARKCTKKADWFKRNRLNYHKIGPHFSPELPCKTLKQQENIKTIDHH